MYPIQTPTPHSHISLLMEVLHVRTMRCVSVALLYLIVFLMCHPIIIIKHKDGSLSVSDGLNRLKKAISIEKRDTIPAYHIPEEDIEHLKIKSKK